MASAGFDSVRVPSWLMMQIVLKKTKLSWRWGVFRNFFMWGIFYETGIGSYALCVEL